MAKSTAGPLRWTLAAAVREFNLDRKTLEKRLTSAEQSPSEDGCYSTPQLLIAVSGDLEAEKIRKTRAEANLAELKEAKIRREVYEAETVKTVVRNFMIAVRAAIMAQDIDLRAKQKITQAIKDIPDDAFYSDDSDETSDDQKSD